MKNYPLNSYTFGIYNKLPIQKTPEGAAYDSLNWITLEGAIELRRGYYLLGKVPVPGAGRVTGLGIGLKADGTEVPYFTYGRTIKYYDSTAEDVLPMTPNGSYSLNGTNQYFSHASASAFDMTGDMTIEAWFNFSAFPTEGNAFDLVTRVDDNSHWQYSLYFNTNDDYSQHYQLFFTTSSTGTSGDTVSVDFNEAVLNTWTHIAVVFHSEVTPGVGSATFYINGVQQGSVQTGLPSPMVSVVSSLKIGNGQYGFFAGKMAEIRLWNVARTLDQISGNCFSSLTGSETGLAGYWKLNNSLSDLTSNANTLTNNNSALSVLASSPVAVNILPAAASGEDVSIEPFASNAGNQIWVNSPNSGPKKIMVANPADYTDMFDSSVNYMSLMRIKQNRSFLFNITNTSNSTDKNSVRLSYLNTKNLTDFTLVTAEALATGDATTKTFSGTLAFKGGSAKRTCLSVSVTDSVETFIDDGIGLLVGSLGGTGTINYTTGAYSVTFNTAPILSAAITSTYRWENSNDGDGTTGGISNFVVPATRIAGNPNVFAQSEGGFFQNLFSLNNVEYCGHSKKFWALTLSSDDTKATNYIYREKTGIPYYRAGIATQEGIYCVDVSDENGPKIVLITIAKGSVEVIPRWISQQLDLTNYDFSQSAAFEWNDYIVFACKTADSAVNNRAFLYNTRYKTFDLVDYYISCLDNFNGDLIAGDSASNNLQNLFSGFDDNGTTIYNYWKSGIMKLGTLNSRGKKYPLLGQKKVKKLQLEGYIAPDQWFRVFVSLDRGAFVEITDPNDTSTDATAGAFIKGNGAYVDHSPNTTVGSVGVGIREVGDGSTGLPVGHYSRILDFSKDKFVDIQIMFQAGGIGYVSNTLCFFRDVRIKQFKVANKYRQ